tara:strand:+ start:217 stop:810 length:594 start_codon:yes stop_codon:yes gene_type:complete
MKKQPFGKGKTTFKLRSGNKPSIAKLSGVSPMKQDIDPLNPYFSQGTSTADSRFDFKSEKRASKKPKYKPDMKVKIFKDKELDDAVKRAKEASKQTVKPKTTKSIAPKATTKVPSKGILKRFAKRFIPVGLAFNAVQLYKTYQDVKEGGMSVTDALDKNLNPFYKDPNYKKVNKSIFDTTDKNNTKKKKKFNFEVID